jgi:hypothetical protein
MSAIVGVLNESLTEAIKSFYKMRKAYLTLEGVMNAEKKYLKERSTSSLDSFGSAASKQGSIKTARAEAPVAPGSSTTSITNAGRQIEGNKDKEMLGKSAEKDDEDDDDFVDADEDRRELGTPQEYTGHIAVATDGSGQVALNSANRDVSLQSSSASGLPSQARPDTTVPQAAEDFAKLTLSETVKEGEDISSHATHPVDVFIISGANFCFGILLVIISLVPPAFATLLKIVGFKGDRERGIQMLWQASKYHNIHGAMGGLILLGFYNGFIGMCDVLPQSGEGAYPKARLLVLLAEMRKRYPQSQLWLLEEGRMMANERQLEDAVDFVAKCPKSPLKQLEALQWFERSLNTMYLHRYEDTASAFEMCVTLNNWSHGLYFFICGASYVELYRQNKTTNPTEANKHAVTAEEFFRKAALNTGKKKFMARQLPFDIFVNRKINKWDARAKEWKCDFIDAIGVSPMEEMIYFWNGYKRMRPDHMQVSLDNLAWSESADNPHWAKEDLDEKAVLALLRAAALRNMDRTTEAMAMLKQEIIVHDRTLLRGGLKDDWTAPCARYEMAANVWREAESDGKPEMHKEKLEECKTWLVEVSNWDASFNLDAR